MSSRAAILALALLAGCAHGSKRARSPDAPVQGCTPAPPPGWKDLAEVVRYELWLAAGREGLTEAEDLAEVELTLLDWHPDFSGRLLGYFWARTKTREGAQRWHLVHAAAAGAAPPVGVHPPASTPEPAWQWSATHPPSRAEAARRRACLAQRYALDMSRNVTCAESWQRRLGAASSTAAAGLESVCAEVK